MPEPAALAIAVAAAAGYLLGSIPVARWVAARRGVDPLVDGERNPGATNVWRLAGARAGLLVLSLDLAKGLAGAVVGLFLGGWWAACAGVVFTMAGHAWPVWSRFRGGRSVACLVGGGMVLAPLPFAIAAAVFGLLVPVGLWRAAATGILAFPLLFGLLAVDRWRLIGIGVAYLVLLAAWSTSSRRQALASPAGQSSMPAPVRSRPIMPSSHSSPRRNGQQSNE